MSNIICIPYEAVMSQELCTSRKKAGLDGDGLTNRKCIDCPGGGLIMEESREVMKCNVCGEVADDPKKFLRKSQECKKCYDKRWQRERKEKLKESAYRVKKVEPVNLEKVKSVKPKPANGSAVAEKSDEETPMNGTAAAITRLVGEIEYLENQKEGIEYKLSVLRDVRGMLG